jgi:hypothetical protein
MRNVRNIAKILQERFGDPIGSYAGDAPVGVRDEVSVCPHCGMMPVGGRCGCSEDCGCGAPSGECSCGMKTEGADVTDEGLSTCDECGMLEVEGGCGCTHEM